MASRLFSRSKTLTLARLLANPSVHGLRPLSSVPKPSPYPSPSPSPSPVASVPAASAASIRPLAGFSASPPLFGPAGSNQNLLKSVGGIEGPDKFKLKDSDSSKILAFSPLETSLASTRKTGLWNESLKVKRLELSLKMTYALIPALLLISKTKLTTSLLVLSVYWQIYGFYREILLDYVHHEVTRKWVFIYFQLLLLILAKDTILIFGQGQA